MVAVGIDSHKHVHVAVAVGDDGRPVGKPLTVKNDTMLIITLLKWVARSPTAPLPGPSKTAAGCAPVR